MKYAILFRQAGRGFLSLVHIFLLLSEMHLFFLVEWNQSCALMSRLCTISKEEYIWLPCMTNLVLELS